MSRCKYLENLDAPWFRCEWQCSASGEKYDSYHDDQKKFVENVCDTDKHYDCPIYRRNN